MQLAEPDNNINSDIGTIRTISNKGSMGNVGKKMHESVRNFSKMEVPKKKKINKN